MKKILFVTQNLARTGSEMLLWYSLCNLNKEEFKSYLFLKDWGELADQLPDHIQCFLNYKRSKKIKTKLFRVILKIFGINPLKYQLQKIQNLTGAEYWYLNTIANPEVYDIAKSMGVKIITHFHELPMAYSFISYNDMKKIMSNTNLFIGCSQVVCDKIRWMGGDNVNLLYGFIDTTKVKYTVSGQEVKHRLKIGLGDFVWAIAGKTTLIKGIDFLIPLLEKLSEEVKIVWIGGEENSGVYFYVRKTIENRFPGRVKFVGEQKAEEYYNYLNCADAFLLLSREDSFPLVMLEAAALGKPIVGFGSGGISEFVDDNMGIVVDSWNYDDLSQAMTVVQQYPDRFNVEAIKKKASGFDVSKQVEKWAHILEHYG